MGFNSSYGRLRRMGLHQLAKPECNAQSNRDHSAKLQNIGRQSSFDLAQLWHIDCDLFVYMDLDRDVYEGVLDWSNVIPRYVLSDYGK